MELINVVNLDSFPYLLIILGVGIVLYFLLKWRNNKNDN